MRWKVPMFGVGGGGGYRKREGHSTGRIHLEFVRDLMRYSWWQQPQWSLIKINIQDRTAKMTKRNVITDNITRKSITILLVIIREQFMLWEGWFYCLKVIGFPSWSSSVALLVWHLSGKHRVPPPDIKEEFGQFNNATPTLWQQCQ